MLMVVALLGPSLSSHDDDTLLAFCLAASVEGSIPWLVVVLRERARAGVVLLEGMEGLIKAEKVSVSSCNYSAVPT